jgi:hypothetical protein
MSKCVALVARGVLLAVHVRGALQTAVQLHSQLAVPISRPRLNQLCSAICLLKARALSVCPSVRPFKACALSVCVAVCLSVCLPNARALLSGPRGVPEVRLARACVRSVQPV